MEHINRSIAVVGFPGVGKTTLMRQLEAAHPDPYFCYVELPGIVMLGRNTPAEKHTYDFLLGRNVQMANSPPYGIVALVDAASLDRQFYLIFQLIDLRLPFLLCVKGQAEAAAAGVSVDVERLASLIGVSVVTLPSENSKFAKVLGEWQENDVDKVKRQPTHWRPSTALADAYKHLDSNWSHKHLQLYTGARLVEGLRLLTVPRAVEEYEGHPAYNALLRNLDEARKMLEDKNEKWTMAEVIQRSNWIGQVLQSAVKKQKRDNTTPEHFNWWKSFFKK